MFVISCDCHMVSVYRFVGELERVEELEGATVFERKVVRTGEKRKRESKGDPGEIDGYMGKQNCSLAPFSLPLFLPPFLLLLPLTPSPSLPPSHPHSLPPLSHPHSFTV